MGQPLSHMEQLLLVTSCDSTAGIGASLRTDERTNERTDERTHTGWTDRRDVGNSVLDWKYERSKLKARFLHLVSTLIFHISDVS